MSNRTRASARKVEIVEKVIVKPKKRSRSRRRVVEVPKITPSDLGEAPARTTMSPVVSTSRIQRLLNGPAMTEAGEEFVRYHLDPAGYHETIGKKGRMIYIPDGALDKGGGGR